MTLKLWGTFLGWFIGYQIVKGQLSIGELVSLTMYLGQLNEPIKAMAGMYEGLLQTAISAQRLDDIFNEPMDAYENQRAEASKPITQGVIEFKEVSFGYQSAALIINQLNLTVPSRSSLAIVGPSGSGKSTLINLILRYYPVTGGSISIDGAAIEDYPLNDLRRQIGFVSQDIMLFPGSVADNLTYGLDRTLSEDELKEACRQASFLDVVENLSDGLSTRLGGSGTQLSGGQRQRLAIARALLRQPKILIFDEATSALDSESEFRIQETIDHIMKQVTTILIAHRLSTIKKAHSIVVLEQGRLVEQGRFEDLLAKKGAFFRFYNFQFGGYQVFVQKLDLELERAKRFEQTFSVLYVRLANDARLRQQFPAEKYLFITEEVSLFIQKTIRKIDYAVQISGNAFAIVFPNTSHENSKLGAVRIKNFFAASEIGNHLPDHPLEVGLASFPEHPVVSGEDLIVYARQTLEVSP
jgi:ABC-type proline/glycine betaine transport system ATPase subunit